MPQTPRILVIRRRYLGDVVLLGSLFRNLRLHWPGAHIAALVEPAYSGILALNPDVDAALAPPMGASAWPGFLMRLRSAGYTHVLDIDNTEKTALIARLSGAPFRVALHHGAHPLKLRALYTHAAHDPAEAHEAQPISEYYLKALGPAGVPVATREIRLVARESDVADWRRFVGAQGRTLLVHPGSRSACRIWPTDRFAAVCDRVQDELGAQVVLAGGPAERRLVAEIRSQARSHVLALDEAPSLPRLAALARASTALLCHDSGPMHIAAAVGTPVVALYGSQNPVLFRPAGQGHALLAPPMPCTPCVAPAACVPGDSYRNYCVRRLTVDQVFGAVRAVLARAP
ncbi:MAG TPA: glycosyltransferase family 9 protein [Opitutaceae bacterium]|nr:glycosyltransferase family 9 protein [Opitutaceae bacterium]